MNLLLIISSFFTVTVAQQSFLYCNYWSFGETYVCDLTINNPNGLNNFTEIGGIHLEGFTNADIIYVIVFSGNSPNVPRVICDTFPNVYGFDFYNTGLTEIDDNSFGGCSRVDILFLDQNRIGTISANAFVNLRHMTYLRLDNNNLTTLPETVFANQRNLTELFLNRNPIEDFPADIFRPIENLQILEIANANLKALNNQWFISNTHLTELYLFGNKIVLSADSFSNLDSLLTLNLASNAINGIPSGTFAPLSNLRNLYLRSNNFTELQPHSFLDLRQLVSVDISDNPIEIVYEGAFSGLENLTSLDMSYCRLRQLNSNVFEDLETLVYISLNFNEFEELPQCLFVPLPNLLYIGFWNNRLKTLNRNSFGTLTNLGILDLDFNAVNALDRAIIDDAVNLNTLYFNRNLCANQYFGSFQTSRPQYLAILERCFYNFRYIVETITEGGDNFSFFEGPNPGIALRVNTDSEVQIALTPFNFIWTPMIEIFIGSANNTISTIPVNQETNVATVPTPNIITRGQWNDFRITWANRVILVYAGNDTFPFISFTMQDFFPVNFYGLRSVDTRASWSVQPIQF